MFRLPGCRPEAEYQALSSGGNCRCIPGPCRTAGPVQVHGVLLERWATARHRGLAFVSNSKCMKTFLFFTWFLASCLASKAQSWNINLNWNASPVAELVTNYNVYQSVGVVTNFVLLSRSVTNSFSLTNAVPGTYRYRVSAQNGWGEGLPSLIVSVPPGMPSSLTGMKVTVTITQ